MTELETLIAQREVQWTRLQGGIKSMQHGDTRKENFSAGEQIRLLGILDARIALLSGIRRRRVWYSYQHSKGL